MSEFDPDAIERGVQAGERAAIARAITLVESRRLDHRTMAIGLLERLETERDTVRIGVSGLPGSGKSSFIERLGLELIASGHRVAVLAIDPSSERTGGSILGDKTRMTELSRHQSAFVRPSPTSGTLGGVALRTREAIEICEAAGFDRVIVETVGVGQSEIVVEGLVDTVLLLSLAGAGDELQGIKRGILEIADVIAVNQCDRDPERAREHGAELRSALRYVSHSRRPAGPIVVETSAKTGEGISEVAGQLETFAQQDRDSGLFARRRSIQRDRALFDLIGDERSRHYEAWSGRDDSEKRALAAVRKGMSPGRAARTVVEDWLGR